MPHIRNIQQIQASSNSLDGVFHFGFKFLFKKWAKEKKEDDTFLIKKKQKKKVISVNGKWTVF